MISRRKIFKSLILLLLYVAEIAVPQILGTSSGLLINQNYSQQKKSELKKGGQNEIVYTSESSSYSNGPSALKLVNILLFATSTTILQRLVWHGKLIHLKITSGQKVTPNLTTRVIIFPFHTFS